MRFCPARTVAIRLNVHQLVCCPCRTKPHYCRGVRACTAQETKRRAAAAFFICLITAPTPMRAEPVTVEIHEWKSVIDERLADLLPPVRHTGDAVCEAMREGLLGPGKRIRPLMTLSVSLGFGQDPMKLLDVACALEMVHAASLFLDDLPCMDDAAERRGRPALHLQFGEDTALL